VFCRYTGCGDCDLSDPRATSNAELAGQLRGRGLTVLLKGVDDRHLRTLAAVGVLDALAVAPSSVDPAGQSHLLPDMDSAMTHARAHPGAH
jgi:SulP family sulfate permease